MFFEHFPALLLCDSACRANAKKNRLKYLRIRGDGRRTWHYDPHSTSPHSFHQPLRGFWHISLVVVVPLDAERSGRTAAIPLSSDLYHLIQRLTESDG